MAENKLTLEELKTAENFTITCRDYLQALEIVKLLEISVRLYVKSLGSLLSVELLFSWIAEDLDSLGAGELENPLNNERINQLIQSKEMKEIKINWKLN